MYSINGYLIALRSRSAHTVCTEGKSDRKVVKHCLLKLVGDNEILNACYVVDTMEIIESDGETIGNSDKLKKICELLADSPINQKVTALVDREYEAFDIERPDVDLHPLHKSQYGYMFYTRGHSLENYFFEPSYFIQYIEFQYADFLTASHRTFINQNWQGILLRAAALTYSIHESKCCTKTNRLFRVVHWNHIGNNRVEINYDLVRDSLESRGIPTDEAVKIVERAKSLYPIFTNKLAVSRWITHGHVGLDLICGAVGCILSICGVDAATCNFLTGDTEIKMKHFAKQWANDASTSKELFPVDFFDRILHNIQSMECKKKKVSIGSPQI